VYTSSSTAATVPKPNKKFTITKDTWNTEDIEAAWKPLPYEDSRKWAVYGASKTQAEQELWKFVAEQKPHFSANSILPNANYGPLIFPTQAGSTNNWVTGIYKGESEHTKGIPPRKLLFLISIKPRFDSNY
jgi:nucleoside-diphosphate-sugar epimerase